jgi:hypothetical protein
LRAFLKKDSRFGFTKEEEFWGVKIKVSKKIEKKRVKKLKEEKAS